MGKGHNNRTERRADMEKAALKLGTLKPDKPLVLPTVPALDPRFVEQMKIIEEKQNCSPKAFRRELASQLKKAHLKFVKNELAVILWAIHKIYGYDYYELLRFVAEYKETCKALSDFYDYDYEDEETCFLFADKLRQETGVDVMKIDAQVAEIKDPKNGKHSRSKKFKERAE